MKSTNRNGSIFHLSAFAGAIAALFLFRAVPVSAQFDYPSPAEIADDMEDRYHISGSTVRDYAEGFNVSTEKGYSPEVSLFFSPSDPKIGEKVIAKAFPSFFSNPDDQLFYTWYLKRDGCDLDNPEHDYCDADEDGRMSVNDWKVAAARILVSDNADREGFVYDNDDDGDGYDADYGGELEADTNDWCYMQDTRSGELYELENGCVHLFPVPSGTGEETGDGSFGVDEEYFWHSNPHDPDTGDNGNKDEANAVGLGQESFTWNYQAGDQLGVVVEGTSMISTKHDDSSKMVMWAFSQNERCPIVNVDGYTQRVAGYDVYFQTTDPDRSDFDDCLESNLVDPTEGGQAKSKKLELSVSATPENPTNDSGEGFSGDTVFATAAVTNSSRTSSEILYSWSVWLSDNPVDGWRDVTGALRDADLLPAYSGNGLNDISVKLNMDDGLLGQYGVGGVDPIYMRIQVEAQENFSTELDVARPSGESDVIVRISNTDKRIESYTAVAIPGDAYRVDLGDSDDADADALTPICDTYYPNPSSTGEAMENLNRIACRVIRNEIIGVRVDPSGLENFNWSVNGVPLRCTAGVSPNAACQNDNGSGNVAFFAVAGEPGETYTVSLEAVDTQTGQSLSLSRKYQIVEPEILIESADENYIWPKYVGTFTELNGQSHMELSDTVFETNVGDPVTFTARTVPGYVENYLSAYAWTVDGVEVGESSPLYISYQPPIEKRVGQAYFVRLSGIVTLPTDIRMALRDVWGIDALESDGSDISQEVRVGVVETGEDYGDAGSNRFFATVSRYVPPFVFFAFRMILTTALLLFTVGFVTSLVPQTVPNDRDR